MLKYPGYAQNLLNKAIACEQHLRLRFGDRGDSPAQETLELDLAQRRRPDLGLRSVS